jgi:hypothetical protein
MPILITVCSFFHLVHFLMPLELGLTAGALDIDFFADGLPDLLWL